MEVKVKQVADSWSDTMMKNFTLNIIFDLCGYGDT